MPSDDSEMIEVFIGDATEQLEVLEAELLNLEDNPEDPETIKKIFRAVHTLKGSAGFVDFSDIEAFAHLYEELLSSIRDGRITIHEDIMEALLTSKDIISAMINYRVGQSDYPDETKVADMKEELKRLNSGSAEKLPEEEEEATTGGPKRELFKVAMNLRTDVFETGTDPLLLIDDLANHCKILDTTMVIKNVPVLTKINVFENYLAWNIIVECTKGREQIDDVFIFASMDNDIQIEKITDEDLSEMEDSKIGELLVQKGYIGEEEVEEAMEKHKKLGDDLVKEGKVTRKLVDSVAKRQEELRKVRRTSTLRIETDKLDRIIESVGEVVVVKSRIRELLERKGWLQLEEEATLTELDRYITQLQKDVMNTRMVPIKDTLLPFRRLVRDLSKKQGKDIEFEIKGEDTELDKTVTEKIKDPLKHMLRNSVDHGIETPEERIAAGKPKKGKLLLEASHQNGEVLIELTDDGKGIDPEKIKEKAVSKGLLEEGATLTKEEALRMIFNPGFSTAKEVTDVSGRGVGMDVVMDNINTIQGDVEVHSEKGEGTEFTIHIPLTLAIIDGILVRVGTNKLIIPIQSVVSFQPLDPKNVHNVNNTKALSFRGGYIPVINLGEYMDYKAETNNMVVIVQSGNKYLALILDEVVGKYQIVIKSLEENFKKIKNFAGATVLGDGSVALILDVKTLLRNVKNVS